MEAQKKPADTSIVHKLLRDIADPAISVASLLRTAKIVATKLGQSDALHWINRELDGYCDGDEGVPPYRRLHGSLRAFHPVAGWKPILFPDPETEEILSAAPMGSSLGSLEQGFSRRQGKGEQQGFGFSLTPSRKATTCQAIGTTTEVVLDLDAGQLWGIIDRVRNLLLDWALELDRAGVVGIDMDFSPMEKQEAKVVTQNFFIQNAGVVGNVTDGATVSNNQSASVNLDIGAITAFAQQARAHLGSLPQDARVEFEPVLNNIEIELAKPTPDREMLRDLLGSAKAICEGAVGNLAASGMLSLIGAIIGA